MRAIDLPPIRAGDEQNQINQLHDYLVRLATKLNEEEPGSGGGGKGEKGDPGPRGPAGPPGPPGSADTVDYGMLRNPPAINQRVLASGENSLAQIGIGRANNMDINSLFA